MITFSRLQTRSNVSIYRQHHTSINQQTFWIIGSTYPLVALIQLLIIFFYNLRIVRRKEVNWDPFVQPILIFVPQLFLKLYSFVINKKSTYKSYTSSMNFTFVASLEGFPPNQGYPHSN